MLLETATSDSGAAEPSGLAVSEASTELLDPIARLLRLLDRPDDVAVLGPMLEREILWRLLTGEQGGTVRQIGLADSRLSQLSRAIRWIRAHYAETLRIEDLAQVAGMSASSFHRHFRAVTAMSPLQYQKQIRLQEARAAFGGFRGRRCRWVRCWLRKPLAVHPRIQPPVRCVARERCGAPPDDLGSRAKRGLTACPFMCT